MQTECASAAGHGPIQEERYERLIELSQELGRIKDLDMLLELVLSEARAFVGADAGSIYIREENALKFSNTQNATLQAALPPGRKLPYSTFTIQISDQSIAGYVAISGEILNIPDAYELPPGVPYHFRRHYDVAAGYRTRSMLTVPLKNTRGGIVGVLQLINATGPGGRDTVFRAEDEPLVMHMAHFAATAIERAQMTRAMIMRMINMSALRDPKETGAHVNRVAAYAVEIYETWARRRGIPEDQIQHHRDMLRMAAMLHDVGKIAIPDVVLKKPGRLDPEETAVMQQHSRMGACLFGEMYSEYDEASIIVALEHHEKWDGTGYPGYVNIGDGSPMEGYADADGKARRKRAEEIHPFGRVVTIADVFDALSSRRAYKEPWDIERVLETMRADAGTHFDPEMIEAFFENIDAIRAIAARYPG